MLTNPKTHPTSHDGGELVKKLETKTWLWKRGVTGFVKPLTAEYSTLTGTSKEQPQSYFGGKMMWAVCSRFSRGETLWQSWKQKSLSWWENGFGLNCCAPSTAPLPPSPLHLSAHKQWKNYHQPPATRSVENTHRLWVTHFPLVPFKPHSHSFIYPPCYFFFHCPCWISVSSAIKMIYLMSKNA